MLTRAQGGLAAAAVMLVTAALVALDLTDRGFRSWWADRAFATDVAAGVLVLLITLLVVDQLVRRRQLDERSRVVAAQAAILLAQAARSSQAVSSALAGSSDRAAAADEVRTYMMMLLVAAPVLIEGAVSRSFLEHAQQLGGELARVLTALARTADPAGVSRARIDDAVAQLRTASTPLLQVLDVQELIAVGGSEPS